jgi:peroxiredoxin
MLLASQLALAEDHSLMLDGTDGQKHALNEYIGHGQWVVLNVWATACPYCRHELDDLIDFHHAHHDKDAIVLGLTLDFPSFDFPDQHHLANFASDHFIDYPLLLVNGEVASQVIGEPVDMVLLSFFYNPEGKLVFRLNGMVTEQLLEKLIQLETSNYQTGWAEAVPPEYKPKRGE